MAEVLNESTDTRFDCSGNETILEAALRQGHVLPYSCRNGTCSSCKAVLVSGEVDPGDCDPGALTDTERAAGKVLLCQARPKGDVVIRAREAAAASGIAIKLMPCRVTAMDKAAHDVMVVSLALPKVQTLEFLAGQYIDILMRDGRRRSFSIATKPAPGEDLELHIRHVPGGRFSTQVFESMKPRDLLRFEGPLGTFFLRESTALPALLVAGGTGFAPIKSMVEDTIAKEVKRPLHIFWGVRAKRDLYMSELCERWAADHKHIQFTPVLSEPDDDDEWSGATGFVHEAVIKTYADLSGHEVYASGPPAMIDAGRAAFADRGLVEDNLYFDSFEYAPDGA